MLHIRNTKRRRVLIVGRLAEENVNILIRDAYSAIKAADASIRFGISPQGNDSNNYNSQYIDVDKWLSNKGYVDYICPQIYFGFNNSTSPLYGDGGVVE